MKLNILSSSEKKVIVNKSTEIPYSGEYENFYGEGCYKCRRCEAYLYSSKDKFDAHCGWPSFDDVVLGAIESKPDVDGDRTEISCRRCGAHLGHLFLNEELTSKNTRYCVNSISMKFTPIKDEGADVFDTAYFGGGCFWCLEAAFKTLKGVISINSGYAGGKAMANDKAPKYEEVSTGETGYAEIVMVKFDKRIISYEALLNVFFVVHDPTTLNRQGSDIGTQYRSIILFEDDLQKEIAQNFINKLETAKIYKSKVVTEIKPLLMFYPAEEYHRDFYNQNPKNTYCQAVVNPKLSKLREHFKSYLKPQADYVNK